MIKNERQYKLTKAQAREFLTTLDELRRTSKPEDMPPLLWKAQIDALQSQYEDLESELSQYEALQEARPALIEVKTLEELPHALIKARIALDLSHKELAERMGLKEQQIQRYEATDYATATISRLTEVANALGIRVSQSVFLPNFKLTKNALTERTNLAGISSDFLYEKILPSHITTGLELNEPDEEESAVRAAADVLQRVFGWSHDEMFGSEMLEVPAEAAATARFKIPTGAQGKRLSAYVAYAHYLSIVVANACKTPIKSLGTDPAEVRSELVKRDPNLGLRSVLEFLWDNGIPVIPLDDVGTFHGACWRIGGRNVITVKQRSPFLSRWVFDVLHEFYHATQNPQDPSHSWIEDGDLTSTRRTSPEEQAANRFAGDVVLDCRAEKLVAECVSHADGNIPYLKNAVLKVANAERVEADHLANYLAYRLSLQKVNWWGTATNLQVDRGNPFLVARDVFFSRFDFSSINDLDAKILRRALMPSGGLE